MKTTNPSKGAELKFAAEELQRCLPEDVKWCSASEVLVAGEIKAADASDLVLVLEHPWISLDHRCLERLCNVLCQGSDWAEACDSNNFAPMLPPNYATLRGMERYVESHGAPVAHMADQNGASTPLLSLTTIAALRGEKLDMLVISRVLGAYVHDVSGYFLGDRADVISCIPSAAQSCLDVGGGEGNFLKLLKCQRQIETHLVELDADVARQARENGCADFVTSGDFLDYSTAKLFDCITFLDMLEHVETPEKYIQRARNLLSEHGVVVASIPNVGHWSVVLDLLEGRWDYVPAGIQCITHLRFFTLSSIEALFARCKFKVEQVHRTSIPFGSSLADKFHGLAVDTTSLDTYSYLVVARPI